MNGFINDNWNYKIDSDWTFTDFQLLPCDFEESTYLSHWTVMIHVYGRKRDTDQK